MVCFSGVFILIMEKEGFSLASQAHLAVPKISCSLSLREILTAAPEKPRCIRPRRRSVFSARAGARRSGLNHSVEVQKSSPILSDGLLFCTEKEGFEPSRRFPDLLP